MLTRWLATRDTTFLEVHNIDLMNVRDTKFDGGTYSVDLRVVAVS
jgi:hypothetical protein